jgi:hypothetical protein
MPGVPIYSRSGKMDDDLIGISEWDSSEDSSVVEPQTHPEFIERLCGRCTESESFRLTVLGAPGEHALCFAPEFR